MALIFKPFDILVYTNWCDAIIAEGWSELNDWEKQFVNDIAYKLRYSKEYKLTEAQHNKLEDIYARVTN